MSRTFEKYRPEYPAQKGVLGETQLPVRAPYVTYGLLLIYRAAYALINALVFDDKKTSYDYMRACTRFGNRSTYRIYRHKDGAINASEETMGEERASGMFQKVGLEIF